MKRLVKFFKSKTGKLSLVFVLPVVFWLIWNGLSAFGNLKILWENRQVIWDFINSPLFVLIVLVTGLIIIIIGLRKEDWLYKLAEKQKLSIADCVFVKTIYGRFLHHIDNEPAEILFQVTVFNASVFEILLLDRIDGDIEFMRQPLSGVKKINSGSFQSLKAMTGGNILVTQKFAKDERELLSPVKESFEERFSLHALRFNLEVLTEDGEKRPFSVAIPSSLKLDRN